MPRRSCARRVAAGGRLRGHPLPGRRRAHRGRTSTRSRPRPRRPGRAACIWARRDGARLGRAGRQGGRAGAARRAGRRRGRPAARRRRARTRSPRPRSTRCARRSPAGRTSDPDDGARVRLGRGLPALRAATPRPGSTCRRTTRSRRRIPADRAHARQRPRPRAARCTTTRCTTATSSAADRSASPIPALQRRIFELLGIPEAEIRRRFGFLLDGLAAGAPPHGGFALGFDRIAMLLAGATSLRDVIAFPKTTAARALFEGAPTPVRRGRPAGAAPAVTAD